MQEEGVACMARRSLGTRLGPLTNLLVLTCLTQGLDIPDFRPQGDPGARTPRRQPLVPQMLLEAEGGGDVFGAPPLLP